MTANITYTADEYAKTKKGHPFRTDVEMYTIFHLLGDVDGKKILDAGCGDGVYSRKLINLGAAHVIGVDGAEDFIELAKKKNEGFEGKIDYYHAFIQDFPGNADRDAIAGSYILSYPRDLGEAIEYCKAMASHLKDRGRFIGFNNNPFEVFHGVRHAKYGFEKQMNGSAEGKEVSYKVSGMDNFIINYYLRPETYARAFAEAGFSSFGWQRVLLHPSQNGNSYWNDFFANEPPFIAMLAKK